MLEKHLWNSFLLYLQVQILQLVQEISNFPEVLYKRGVLKNFSKFTNKHKKQWYTGILSKDVLKNFTKLTEKHLCRSLFFDRVPDWKPETVRSRCSPPICNSCHDLKSVPRFVIYLAPIWKLLPRFEIPKAAPACNPSCCDLQSLKPVRFVIHLLPRFVVPKIYATS